MRLQRFALALSLSTLFLAATASAGTYYVATNGNDSTGTGTITNPFATISGACVNGTLYSDLTAGNPVTINVRGGIYYGHVGVWIDGTANGRLTIQAYPGEYPILDGSSNMGTSTDVVGVGGAYVDFIGFEIRNSPHVGYVGWGQTYGKVLNCTIHDSQGDGIWIGEDTPGVAHDMLIAGNSVYHNCLSNSARTNLSGGWPQAIGISAVPNTTVRNNRVFRNYGEGIIMGPTDNSFVIGNEVFDNFSNNIYLEHAQTTVVDGNLCYSFDTNYYRNYGSNNWQPAMGIVLANEHPDAPTTHTLANDTIINNVIIHPYWGIGYWRDDSGLNTIKFANNTVYDPTGDALHIDYDSTATGIIVENNIFALSSGSTARVVGGYDLSGNSTTTLQSTGFTFRYNLWSSAPSAPAHTTTNNDQVGSPAFVMAGGHNAEDYKLTSTSPAKDHGSTLSYVTVDYARKPRGGTYEMGAWEY
ncbi:MAG TPA: right-handed parallel beta-helix repeat-containing protein [Thermoanaerobaculia bacterium]|nr:right-handed parallel beta-helix repeat-containing protein [Thermoanaerobaculia bacterium]